MRIGADRKVWPISLKNNPFRSYMTGDEIHGLYQIHSKVILDGVEVGNVVQRYHRDTAFVVDAKSNEWSGGSRWMF